MSEIPEDIIDSALALAGNLANTPCPTAKLTLIRSAILAERERFRVCGYQRRPAYRAPEAAWSACKDREAMDPFERVPGFEYRPIYTAIRGGSHE